MIPTVDGIFRKPNGMYWAIDPVRGDRIYSLHTKKEDVALATYAKHTDNRRTIEKLIAENAELYRLAAEINNKSYELHKENKQLREQLNKEKKHD